MMNLHASHTLGCVEDSKSSLEMSKHDMEHQEKVNKMAEEMHKEPMSLDQKLEKLSRELSFHMAWLSKSEILRNIA
jgi:hypothetical protein